MILIRVRSYTKGKIMSKINYQRSENFIKRPYARSKNGSWMKSKHCSFKWFKNKKNTERRQLDRQLIHHEKFDDLLTRFPKDILWDWW